MQKSRVKWLSEGDHKTNYFHMVIQSKSARCKIKELTRDDGSIASDGIAITDEILGFFTGLLGTATPSFVDVKSMLHEILPQKLSLELQSLVYATNK